MNACPSNEALTAQVHRLTPGTKCAVVLRSGKTGYELKRLEVPAAVSPELSSPNPRNVVTVEAIVDVPTLQRAMDIVAKWKGQFCSDIPAFLLERGMPGRARWVLLSAYGSPIRSFKTQEFTFVV